MKTVYVFEKGTGYYAGSFMIDDSSVADGSFCTEVRPTQQQLDVASSCGRGSLVFDPSRQKWSANREVAASNVSGAIGVTAREVVLTRSSKLLLKYVVADLIGAVRYPLAVSSEEYEETFEDSEGLRRAFSEAIREEEVAKAIESILVHGGEVAGVDVKPLSEQNLTELRAFSADDAVLQVMDLLESEEQ